MSTKNLPSDVSNAGPLSPTAVQTSNYSAGLNQLVPVNATSGAITVTLPSAPADKTRIGIKKTDTSANAVTTITSGGAAFNISGGPTSVPLVLQNQSVTVQYQSSTNLWIVIVDGLPLDSLTTSLAATYATKANNLSDITNATTARTNLGLGNVTNTADTAKPVSTAQQAALDLKANLASPAITGTPTAPTATVGTNTVQLATTAYSIAAAAAQSAADNAITALGTLSGGTLDLSALTTGGMVVATLGANITTITLPATTPTRFITIEVVLAQDATGSRTITYPAGIKSTDGNSPILSTGAGATDTIAFVWDSLRWKVRLVERGLA